MSAMESLGSVVRRKSRHECRDGRQKCLRHTRVNQRLFGWFSSFKKKPTSLPERLVGSVDELAKDCLAGAAGGDVLQRFQLRIHVNRCSGVDHKAALPSGCALLNHNLVRSRG